MATCDAFILDASGDRIIGETTDDTLDLSLEVYCYEEQTTTGVRVRIERADALFMANRILEMCALDTRGGDA